MSVLAPIPRASRIPVILLGAVLVLYGAELALQVAPAGLSVVLQKLATNVVFLGSAALCSWRGLRSRRERAPWLLLSAGLWAWGLGNVYFTLALWDLEVIPFPSLADVGYLLLYPPVYAGLVLLFRARVRNTDAGLWLDGLTGALAVAALATAVVFDAVVAGTGGSPAAVAVNLAYPLGDVLVLALVAGAMTTTGWTLFGAWSWIAGGLLAFAVADSLYLYLNAVGTYRPGHFFEIGWPLAAWMIAVAAWLRPSPVEVRARQGRATIVLPIALALAAVGLLVLDHFDRLGLLAVVLSTLALLSVLARLAMTLAENARSLGTSRQEATTDSLTGLGNRRMLLRDMAERLPAATPERPLLFALFDLDGFKLYNDTYGHPAGDTLLARLGARFDTAVAGRGTTYRIGGDEFCLLAPLPSPDPGDLMAAARAALSESGEGFAIGSSHGSVLLPLEARSAEDALRVADQRMYGQKHTGRSSAGRQSAAVLLRAMEERRPELARHASQVAEAAQAAGAALGLSVEERDQVRLAAELHDVGKLALPDALLDKPGALNEAEWALVREHSLIGERMIAAAPALVYVARLVRSSHERLDGGGYPDGLRGAQIPLAARIVAVADAYDVMVTGRVYREAVPPGLALAELRRCAGDQFDPVVVEAFAAAVEAAAREGSLSGVRGR